MQTVRRGFEFEAVDPFRVLMLCNVVFKYERIIGRDTTFPLYREGLEVLRSRFGSDDCSDGRTIRRMLGEDVEYSSDSEEDEEAANFSSDEDDRDSEEDD